MSLKLGDDALSIQLTTSDELPVRVEAVGSQPVPLVPLVEVLVLGEGRSLNQTRTLVNTARAQLFRYAGHHVAKDGSDVVEQFSTDGALEARTRIRASDRSLAFRTTLTNRSDAELAIESVTAATLPIPFSIPDTVLATGRSSWCAGSHPTRTAYLWLCPTTDISPIASPWRSSSTLALQRRLSTHLACGPSHL